LLADVDAVADDDGVAGADAPPRGAPAVTPGVVAPAARSPMSARSPSTAMAIANAA
jgi:hypothetical protein